MKLEMSDEKRIDDHSDLSMLCVCVWEGVCFCLQWCFMVVLNVSR